MSLSLCLIIVLREMVLRNVRNRIEVNDYKTLQGNVTIPSLTSIKIWWWHSRTSLFGPMRRRESEILSSWVHSPCFYASIKEWFLLFNSRPYRHYTAVIMLPYQAHISPDTTYTETDSSSVGYTVKSFLIACSCFLVFKQTNVLPDSRQSCQASSKSPFLADIDILQAQWISSLK